MLGGGNSNMFWMFTPNLGEDVIPFWLEHIFTKWIETWNHQLVIVNYPHQQFPDLPCWDTNSNGLKPPTSMTWRFYLLDYSKGQQRWHQRRPPPLHGDQPRDGGSGDTPLGNPTTFQTWILWVYNDLGPRVLGPPKRWEKEGSPGYSQGNPMKSRLVNYFFKIWPDIKCHGCAYPVVSVYICIHGQRHNDVRWVCIDLNLCQLKLIFKWYGQDDAMKLLWLVVYLVIECCR